MAIMAIMVILIVLIVLMIVMIVGTSLGTLPSFSMLIPEHQTRYVCRTSSLKRPIFYSGAVCQCFLFHVEWYFRLTASSGIVVFLLYPVLSYNITSIAYNHLLIA